MDPHGPPPIDEVPPDPVDVEDDPYHVYMLRRPAERASSVVPQLPKQPEMAETRLRYRRIAPEARSGSFGSLGNHFPPRFEFPNRRSLLESLTSDDEASSFAVRSTRRLRDPHKPSKKKKKKRPSRSALTADRTDLLIDHTALAAAASAANTPDPDSTFLDLPTTSKPAKVPPITIASAAAAPDDAVVARAASDSSTPLSTSPTTPVPGSPTDQGNLALPTEAKSRTPQHVGEEAALRLATARHQPRPSHHSDAEPTPRLDPTTAVPTSVTRAASRQDADPSKQSSTPHSAAPDPVAHIDSHGKARRTDSGTPPEMDSAKASRMDSAKAHRMDSGKARRMDSGRARRMDSDRARRMESDKARRTDSDKAHRMDSDKARRMDSDKARHMDSDKARRMDSEKARRMDSDNARRIDSDKARRMDSDNARRLDSGKARRMDSAKARRFDSNKSSSSRRKDKASEKPPRRYYEADPPSGGLTALADGRQISAPEAMNPLLRENFVLRAEQPVRYAPQPRGEEEYDMARHGKKSRGNGKKKQRDGEGQRRPPRPPSRPVADEENTRARKERTYGGTSSTRQRREGNRMEREEHPFSREKELSVSFAHRRYTAEEAATKPLTAIQKLWHVLAVARMTGSRRGSRRS